MNWLHKSWGQSPPRERGAVVLSMSRIILCVAALGIYITTAIGQGGLGKGRLAGAVLDADGKPLAEAKIVLKFIKSPVGSGLNPTWRPESAVFTTATDKDGKWVYNGLEGGIWEVHASKPGYEPSSRQVQVRQLSSNPYVKLSLNKIKEGVYSIDAALLEQANELMSLNKLDEAAALYRKYLEKDPESVMVMLSLADCLRDAGKLAEAIEEYQAVVKKTSETPLDSHIAARALAGLGEAYYKKGDLVSAAASWRSAVEKSPTDEIVAANLAELLFSCGEAKEAARYYLTAIEIAPKRADFRLKLAFVYLNQGDYDKARASLDKVIELEPRSALGAQARTLINQIQKRKKSTA